MRNIQILVSYLNTNQEGYPKCQSDKRSLSLKKYISQAQGQDRDDLKDNFENSCMNSSNVNSRNQQILLKEV